MRDNLEDRGGQMKDEQRKPGKKGKSGKEVMRKEQNGDTRRKM